MTPLFFSTFLYAACKVVGAEHWDRTLGYWLEQEHLDEAPWHSLRVLGQVGRVAPTVVVHADASTYIDRARCVAAGNFLYRAGADCDVWLTCDDDVYADQGVIGRMLEVCRVTRGLVALPYMNRDGGSMTFRKVTGPTVWQPHAVRVVDRVGMGLVAMHRDFVTTLARKAVHFRSAREGGLDSPYIFCNGVEPDGTFIGEDFGMCQLAERAGLPMHVLLDAPGQHMNLAAMLDLEGNVLVRSAFVRTAREGLELAPRRDTFPPEPDTKTERPSG